MTLKILGDETPEAVRMRGPEVPEHLNDQVVRWDDETREVIESQTFETCTIWTATRVLFGRYKSWVSVDRKAGYA